MEAYQHRAKIRKLERERQLLHEAIFQPHIKRDSDEYRAAHTAYIGASRCLERAYKDGIAAGCVCSAWDLYCTTPFGDLDACFEVVNKHGQFCCKKCWEDYKHEQQARDEDDRRFNDMAYGED